MTPVSAWYLKASQSVLCLQRSLIQNDFLKIILVKRNYSIRNIYGEIILPMTLEYPDDNTEFLVPNA